MASKRKLKRLKKKTALERKEEEFLRSTRSSNGATGMHTEGFRRPNPNRKFERHVSKKSPPAVKISIRELADLLYDNRPPAVVPLAAFSDELDMPDES